MKPKQKANYRSFESDADLLIEIKKVIESRTTYGFGVLRHWSTKR